MELVVVGSVHDIRVAIARSGGLDFVSLLVHMVMMVAVKVWFRHGGDGEDGQDGEDDDGEIHGEIVDLQVELMSDGIKICDWNFRFCGLKIRMFDMSTSILRQSRRKRML